MQAVATIGLDIAKSVFPVHGIDAAGNVLIRRQLKRRYVLAFFQKLPPCLVGIEACPSSHHWSREATCNEWDDPWHQASALADGIVSTAFGTSPIQAEKCRPERKALMSTRPSPAMVQFKCASKRPEPNSQSRSTRLCKPRLMARPRST
jgi:hypothetical protein